MHANFDFFDDAGTRHQLCQSQFIDTRVQAADED
jgi:hypothetical protein